MKLCIFILFLFTLQVNASVFAQQTKVNLRLKNVSMKTLFEEIQRQTNHYFVFSAEQTQKLGRFTVEAKDEALNQVLDRVFKNTGFTYELNESLIVVRSVETPGSEEVKKGVKVTGKVTDERRNALPGVTIRLKGTTVGTATNKDGRYTIVFPKAEVNVLVFSFVGMEEQEVTYAGKDTMDVQMKEMASEIDEVVVTGYQTIEKRKLSSSIVSVKGADMLQGTSMSIDRMLQGRLLGVSVIGQTSTPGAAPKIRVRGSSSITGNREPVWVVDGIILEDPVTLSPEQLNSLDKVNLVGNAIASLNPEDIERIDILKDASATAIYGVKAANGVIVVTTKRGRTGHPKVSLSTGVTITSPPTYGKMSRMNSLERVELSEEMRERKLDFNNFNQTIGYEKAVIDLDAGTINQGQFDTMVNEFKTMNTDWYDLLFRTAVSHKHTLSVSGGSDFMDYYFSVGFGNDESVALRESQNQYNVRMKINTRLHETLRMGLSLNGAVAQTERPHSSIDLYKYAYQTSRALPAYDKAGKPVPYLKNYSMLWGDPLSYNIFTELDNSGSKVKNQTLGMDFSLDWDVTSWLRFTSLVNLTTINNTQSSWVGERSHYVAELRQIDYGKPLPTDDFMFTDYYCELPYGGQLNNTDTRKFSYTVRNSVQFAKQFSKHDFLMLFGNEVRSLKTEGLTSMQGGYIPDRGKNFVSISHNTWKRYAEIVSNNPDKVQDNLNNFISYYGTFTYGYDDRYIANFNIRADGSNKFGQDKSVRFLPVWSVSGRWNITSERFMPVVNWVDNLALRASYGVQGNVHEDQTPNLIVEMGTLWATANEYSSRLYKLPNHKLKWEKTRAFNLGLDFALFEERFSGTVELYMKKGIDQVVHKTLAPSSGADYVSINDGNVENKGWELSFSVIPIRMKDVTWGLSFNTSKNYNKVSRAGEKQNTNWDDYINGELVMNGKALDSFYSYQFKSLDENGYPTFNGLDEKNAGGQLIVATQKEAIERALVYSGQRTPDITGGFSTYVRFKNFTLNGLFSFSLGSDIRLNDLYLPSGQQLPLTQQNMSSELVNRWKKPGDEAKTNIPVLSDKSLRILLTDREFRIAENQWEMYNKSDLRVVSGDFLRCRSLSFNYQLDTDLAKKIGMSSATLGLEVMNPFVVASSALKGRDPEQVTMGSGTVPPQKSYSFTLRVSF